MTKLKTGPIMAIDASLTGFAICITNIPNAEDFEVRYSTKPVKTLVARIRRMQGLADKCVGLVKQYKPYLVLIEGYSYSSRGSSSIDLGELGMLIRSSLVNKVGIMAEVSPNILKKFATGKGNANKVAVASALASKYDRTFDTDDQADAFGLSKLGRCVLGLDVPCNKTQVECVKHVTDLVMIEQQALKGD